MCIGLGEAVLCHRGRAVPLATAHSPATNKEERERVKEAGGFISQVQIQQLKLKLKSLSLSQDGRVNGVCGTTRLVGCYHLGPEVIPDPTVISLAVAPGDDYIIIGTDSLWRHVSHERAVSVVCEMKTQSSAARRLRDMAVACGAQTDVSVIVVRLAPPTLGAGFDESESHSGPMERERDQSNEDVEFTNIDDFISDSEENMELGHELTWNGVRTRGVAPPAVGGVSIDEMILSAVSSPPTSPFSPEMKSTNIDDILTSPHSHQEHTLTPHQGHTLTPHQEHTLTPHQEHTLTVESRPTETTKRITRVNSPQAPPTSGPAYPAQTIPRDAAGSRSKGGDLPVPPSQAIDYKQFRDSFEVTQSAPSIPADQQTTPTAGGVAGGRGNDIIGRQRVVEEAGFGGSLQRERDERSGRRRRDTRERGLRGDLTRREIDGGEVAMGTGNTKEYLEQLNRVMTDLDSDPALRNGTETSAWNGGKIQRRLSYVEHSYQQLTNNVYSNGAIAGQPSDHEQHNW